jgi:serine/threonine protein kinase
MGETHGLATATDGVETRALDTGRMIGGRYQVVRELGRGGMGVVYLVRDTFERDRTLALKSVRATDPGSQNVTSLKREFLVLAALRHPGLTPVHDFGCDAQAGELFFASEFVDGVDLSGATQSFDLLSPQGLKEFLGVIVQVLRGLAFVHAHGLIHGDLKPQNILVTGLARGEVPEAKLIDFGITAWEHQFSGKRVLGTKPYIAPEAIVGSHLDRRADLYSLGAMLYHLVVGEPPFGARSSVGVLKDHLETTPDLPTTRRPEVHAGFDDVISRLLRKNPSERYQNALEVVEAINRVFDENFRVETMETGCSYLRCTTATERATELRAMHQVFRAACKIHVVPGDESVYAA